MFLHYINFFIQRNGEYSTGNSLKDVTLQTILLDISSNIMVELILFPVMTCKTRLQSKNGFKAAGGFRNLHSGFKIAVLLNIPYGILFAFVYEYVKNAQFASSLFDNFYKEVLSCCVADVVSTVITVPRDVVLEQQQVSQEKLNPIEILLKAYQSDGLLNGIYQGFWATITRNIPYVITEYFLWQCIKEYLENNPENPVMWKDVVMFVIIEVVVTILLALIVTPMDVAKTRIQLKESDGIRNPYIVIQAVYVEHGFVKVFAGLGARIIYELCAKIIVCLIFLLNK